MPISYLDVPPGIRVDAKRKLVKEVFTAWTRPRSSGR